MYSTSSLQGVWYHIHGSLHQKCRCKVQFDQYVTTNIGVLFPYMVSLYNAVATGCNQSFYKSQKGGNLQLQSSCNQLQSSPVASPSEKLQLDFKTLTAVHLSKLRVKIVSCTLIQTFIFVHHSWNFALSPVYVPGSFKVWTFRDIALAGRPHWLSPVCTWAIVLSPCVICVCCAVMTCCN